MVSSEVGQGVDLADASCVAFAAVEPRLQKRRNDVYDAFPADHPLAHTQDVRIVVQPGQPGGSDGLTDSRTDTLVLVGDDRHTYSSTADQNAPIDLPRAHRFGDGMTPIGVVCRRCRCGPRILHFFAESQKELFDPLFIRESRVVASDGNHDILTFVALRAPCPSKHSCPFVVKKTILLATFAVLAFLAVQSFYLNRDISAVS